MIETWHQFVAMGGYGRYVWSAYGFAALVIAANIVAPMLALRRVKRRIRNAASDGDGFGDD